MNEICVLGLGTMGGRVAAKLVENGHLVRGFDPSTTALGAAAAAGVQTCGDPADAVARARVVVLSLPGPEHVLSSVDGPLAGAATGTVVADLSTIDPDTARQAAQRLAVSGVEYVDAPVLGRPDRCGAWTLPAGGSEDGVAEVRALLEGTVAREVRRVGDVGAGSILKVLNNLMFGAINAVTAEALNACRLAGLDPAVFVETVADSGAGTVSNLFKELGPRMSVADYAPTFALALLQKDNRLAVELARQVGAPAFIATAVDQVNSLAAQLGHGDQDSGAVLELYRTLSADAGQ
ncbi:MAG: NAD(P)-dependent oxidoreductase [Actinopolymorphaceae bacterium]